MKRVIVTGDDFGLAVPVNEAIADAHRRGILTAASLMVGASAAADAVERAHLLPSLAVGLHIVLVEGRPVLPKERVAALVDEKGEFSSDLVRAGFRFFGKPGARRQLEEEIRAQFDSFRRTGLRLDHVNAHNHMHLHPTVLGLIMKVGRDYGMSAMRLPHEPAWLSWRATRSGLAPKLASGIFLFPWLRFMKLRLRRAGIRTNDRLFGMSDSGRMTADRVLRFLRLLPQGVTEIYFHPATSSCPEITRTMAQYRHEDEYRALVDPALAGALARAGAERIAFGNLKCEGHACG